jgi:hypothetical protein
MQHTWTALARSVQRVAAAAAVTCLGIGSPAFASITGVCPDGSIFIVQRAEQVPCRDAKEVDPGHLPPIRPEYLPQPYGWEVFNRESDPNNPYNLIQSEPAPENGAGPSADNHPDELRAPAGETAPEAGIRNQAAARTSPATPNLLEESTLRWEDSELDDLAMIVELSQRRAPASISAEGSLGRVRFARSAAFEARVREYVGQRSRFRAGPVVLFVADTESAGSFYGNLTFVQSGVAFHPSAEDPLQLGVIRGSLGSLEDGVRTLGYVVLPEHVDLSRPIDIYWNDLQMTATLQP